MSLKPTTPNAGQRFARIGLACLAIVPHLAGSAAGQGETKTAPERALAERQVAVKQAAVKIADAQKGVAEAKVLIAKASILASQAAVGRWEAEVKRTKQLQAQGVLDVQTAEETQLRLASAKASLAEAEAKLLLAERAVAVEEARRQLAQAELAEVQLRCDQLGGKIPQAPKKADMQALLKARLDLAKKGYGETSSHFGEVKRTYANVNILLVKPEEIYTWSVRWLMAQREMSDKKEDQVAALDEHLKRVKDLERRVKPLVPEILPTAEATAAAFWVAEAEIRLAKAKATAGDQAALLKSRLDLAKKGYGEAFEGLEVKRPYIGPLVETARSVETYTWSIRWLNAEREMSDKKEERVTALAEHLQRMKELQKKVDALGRILTQSDVTAAAWYVAEAELWLAKEKAK